MLRQYSQCIEERIFERGLSVTVQPAGQLDKINLNFEDYIEIDTDFFQHIFLIQSFFSLLKNMM